jgi:TRAP-type C4-dicarboxylate transport system permease small subunit
MSKVYASICKLEMAVAKCALASLSLLVFVAAIARTVGYPISWAIDVATFLFAWCVFLGGDIAIREDKLFCVELVTAKLPPRAQHGVKIVNYVIIAIFLIAMVGYGSWLSYTTRVRPFQGIPGFSYTWVTISVPIGCALMLLSVGAKIRQFVDAMLEGAPIAASEGPKELL